jgi:hypothetical protein
LTKAGEELFFKCGQNLPNFTKKFDSQIAGHQAKRGGNVGGRRGRGCKRRRVWGDVAVAVARGVGCGAREPEDYHYQDQALRASLDEEDQVSSAETVDADMQDNEADRGWGK